MDKKILWRRIALVGAVLALHIIIVIFYGTQKVAFHEDEYFTYYTSSAYEGINPWGEILELTGDQIQSHFYVLDQHRFAFDKIVEIHSRDVHPPLYYLTLNCFMSFFPYSFYKWFGIFLNLAYSLVACVGLMFFMYKLDKGKHRFEVALIAGALYAIHPAVLSNVMFTRMYSMSTMWTVLYMDVFILLMQNYMGSKKKFVGITVAGTLVCYLAFLTHYFCVYIPFFLTLGFCIYAVVRKVFYKEKCLARMFVYGGALSAGIGLAILTFPASMEHIFGGYQGEWAFGTLLDGDPFRSLIYFLPILNRYFFSGSMYLVVAMFVVTLVVGIVLAIWNKNRKVFHLDVDVATWGISLVAGIITVWLTAETSQLIGDMASRYFYNVAVLIMPLLFYTIVKVILLIAGKVWKQKGTMAIGTVLVVAMLAIPIAGMIQENVLYLYRDKIETLKYAEENAEYPLVMIYDNAYRYKTWYIANETWVYDKVVFIRENGENTVLDHEALKTADKLIVYMDASQELLDRLVEQNENLSSWRLLRHDLHYYVYVLE